MASNAPITFAQGETLGRYAWTVQTAGGGVYDLTGCTAHLTARATGEAATYLVDWSSATGGLAINTATGTITATLTAAASAAVDAGYYYYDLAVTYTDGTREVLFAGSFQVQTAFARYPP